MQETGKEQRRESNLNSRELRGEISTMLEAVSECSTLEADELLRHFSGESRAALLSGTAKLSDGAVTQIREAVQRRLAGEPLQYLLGEWDFFGRTFRVGPGVLIPRADTEILVEVGLAYAREEKAVFIADLCAGSGCIAGTMALELPGTVVFALEKSTAALVYLRENMELLGASSVSVCQEDVLAPVGEYPVFDLILTNPPYITDADMETLQTEVRKEPEMALRGGADGLRFYEGIAEKWISHLQPGGMLACEIGRGQETAVAKIFENNCFKNVCFHRDLCGIIRVVTGNRPVV